MTSTESISEALRRVYPELGRSQQRVARIILDDPTAAILMAAAELAERVGVHPATVVRLAQRLGYDGYPAMQKEIRAKLSQYPTFLHQVERTGSLPDAQALFQQVFGQARRNIEHAMQTVDVTVLEEFAAALVSARRISIVGIGVARPVADYLASSLQITGLHVTLPADPIALTQQVALLDEADAVVLVDFHRYYREVTRLAQVAKESGATVLAITDSQVADFARLTDQLVVVPSEGAAPRTSLTAAMALVESILALVTLRYRTVAEASMQRLDRIFHRLDTFGAD